MSDTNLLITCLVAACVLALILRLTVLKSGSPVRLWFEARIQPFMKRALQAFFVLTLFVWIIAWGTADKEQRGALSISFREFLESMEVELPGMEQPVEAPQEETPASGSPSSEPVAPSAQ